MPDPVHTCQFGSSNVCRPGAFALCYHPRVPEFSYGATTVLRILPFVSLAICLAWISSIAAEDGPSDKIPELKVLDHYAGDWDVEMTSTELPFTKGKVSGKWILDGRFLQQVGELTDKDGASAMKYSSLMTYDPEAKVYRTWSFLSNGHAGESEGKWDPTRKTMNSIGRKDPSGSFSTTTADFSAGGTEAWKIVVTDRTGKVVSEMSGKNTRRKK